MGREARIALMLAAAACLVAVMVDWVVEELTSEAPQFIAGVPQARSGAPQASSGAPQASSGAPQASEGVSVGVRAPHEDDARGAKDATEGSSGQG